MKRWPFSLDDGALTRNSGVHATYPLHLPSDPEDSTDDQVAPCHLGMFMTESNGTLNCIRLVCLC